MSIYRATKAAELQEGPGANGSFYNTIELPQTQTNETNNGDNDQFVAVKIVCLVTESVDTKYLVRLYGYPLKQRSVNATFQFPKHVLTR